MLVEFGIDGLDFNAVSLEFRIHLHSELDPSIDLDFLVGLAVKLRSSPNQAGSDELPSDDFVLRLLEISVDQVHESAVSVSFRHGFAVVQDL